MRCLDSRRLTGPNVLMACPGAVIDVEFDGEDAVAVVRTWRRQVRRMLKSVGWEQERCHVRRFDGGASLAISAPADALYAATDINDWAFDATREVIEYGEMLPVRRAAARLRKQIERESQPGLRRLTTAARSRAVDVVVDADEVSLGYGAGSRTWPVDGAPDPAAVDWDRIHAVPVALVTGTNGKTTSVRLTAAIGAAAGRVTGVSSTDWVAVGDEIIDRDDYAGPGGARRILRDPRVELAILETARGGLLRRGLAVERADAALITNVAADHIGEFGVRNLEELADVKWVVTRALGADGVLVLNADDPLLAAHARRWAGRIIWYSGNPRSPRLRRHIRQGGSACTVRDGHISCTINGEDHDVVAVTDIPVTLSGAAVHNIDNALAACGLALALGLPHDAIAAGLTGVGSENNPGRANLFRIRGASILVDFAHNPHGMKAIAETVRRMPARRRMLVIGQAGDRSDGDIRDLVRAAATIDFDHVMIKQLSKYRRGRAEGETARIIRDEFLALGLAADTLEIRESEADTVRDALAWAGEGDVVVLLIHEDRESALRILGEAKSGSGDVPVVMADPA